MSHAAMSGRRPCRRSSAPSLAQKVVLPLPCRPTAITIVGGCGANWRRPSGCPSGPARHDPHQDGIRRSNRPTGDGGVVKGDRQPWSATADRRQRRQPSRSHPMGVDHVPNAERPSQSNERLKVARGTQAVRHLQRYEPNTSLGEVKRVLGGRWADDGDTSSGVRQPRSQRADMAAGSSRAGGDHQRDAQARRIRHGGGGASGLRALQMFSAGQRRAHSSGTSSSYVVVASSGGRISMRSSITKPFRRSRSIHAP